MKIIYDPSQYHKYCFIYDFSLSKLEYCRHLKDKHGWQQFNFDKEKKGWIFSDPAIIEEIKNRYGEVEICEEGKDEYKRFLIEKAGRQMVIDKANQLKVKTESNLVVPGIKGKMYDFQKIGTEFLINSGGRAILADGCGLGKSLQSLGYVIYNKFKKILVVCPSSVKSAFEKEINKWTDLKCFVVDSKSELDLDLFNKYDIFVINYDILSKHFDFLVNVRWDCAILDEAHYIKGKSIRTAAAKKIVNRIPSVILMSGTILLNRPKELFNALQIVDYNNWNNYYKFSIRYCDGHQGHWGWDDNGASNIEELRDKISPYFLRRIKEDVLKELPPKIFIDIPVELDSESKFNYDLAMSDFVEYLRDIKDKNNREINNSMRAKELVLLNELRQITSNGKIDVAQETIQNIIDGGEKLIVYSCFNEPLEKLHEQFKDISVMIIGSTPDIFRKAAIESFQNDDNIKVFFGGMRSSSTGITLTKASSVLFVDLSYVPADHEQALSRADRIGQAASQVTIYQLYADKTIDEKMKDILADKRDIFNQLIECNNNQILESSDYSSGSIVDELINKIQLDIK